MKLTIALIAFLSLSAHSKECGIDKVNELIERLKTKYFLEPQKVTENYLSLPIMITHSPAPLGTMAMYLLGTRIPKMTTT